MTQESLIFESTRKRQVEAPINDRYHEMHSIFQRFIAQASLVSETEYIKKF